MTAPARTRREWRLEPISKKCPYCGKLAVMVCYWRHDYVTSRGFSVCRAAPPRAKRKKGKK